MFTEEEYVIKMQEFGFDILMSYINIPKTSSVICDTLCAFVY